MKPRKGDVVRCVGEVTGLEKGELYGVTHSFTTNKVYHIRLWKDGAEVDGWFLWSENFEIEERLNE